MRLLRISVLAILLPLAAGCAWLDRSETEDYVTLQATTGSVQVVPTKGTSLTSLPELFRVWGYTHPVNETPTTPNYLCGEVFNRVGGAQSTSYRSALKHATVVEGYRVRYWSVVPDSAVTGLPGVSSSWPATFTYTANTAIASQTDLLVAVSDSPTLPFRHVLGGIRFYYSEYGDSAPPVQVTSLSLSNVKGTGTFTAVYGSESGGTWSTSGEDKVYSISSEAGSNASSNVIYDGDNTMLLIPQKLTTSTLTVNYNYNSSPCTASPDFHLTLEPGHMYYIYLTFKRNEVSWTVRAVGQEVGCEYTGSEVGPWD